MKQYGEKFIDEFSKAELEKLAKQGQLIDVRTEEEYALGHINGSILHPVDEIESFNKEKNKTYYVICRSGNRSANASKYLAKQGYNVINLDGGYKAYEENDSYDTQEEYKSIEIKADRKQFNYRGFQCPGPIVKISQEMKNIEVGDQIEVKVTDPGFPSDIKSWVKQTRHTLVKLDENNNGINAIIQKEKAKDLEKKMRESSFTLDDFLEQLDQVKNLGPLDDIMKMIPGMNKMKGLDKLNMSEKQIDHIKAIIQSMTPAERNNPDTLNVSRKKRIAKGSGRSLQEVNRLMKQFNDMKKMMKQFTGGGKGKKGKRNQMQNMLKGMNLPF